MRASSIALSMGSVIRLLFCLFLGACTMVRAQGTVDCPPPPKLPGSVVGVDYYTDAKHSVVDRDLQIRAEEVSRPLRGALYDLGRLAEGGEHHGVLSTQACALGWLNAWATGNALEQVGKRGTVLQVISVASLSMSYRSALALGRSAPMDHSVVNRWLERLAISIAKNEDVGRPGIERNNVTYWAALASYNISVMTGNSALRDWALNVYNQALNEITEDGFFPSELKRGRQALRYQWFALAPLVALYVMSDDRDGFREESSRVRLAGAIEAARAGLIDGSRISQIAGADVETDGINRYALTAASERLFACVLNEPESRDADVLIRDWRLGLGFRSLRCKGYFDALSSAGF